VGLRGPQQLVRDKSDHEEDGEISLVMFCAFSYLLLQMLFCKKSATASAELKTKIKT
jgi:hypothetical protein